MIRSRKKENTLKKCVFKSIYYINLLKYIIYKIVLFFVFIFFRTHTFEESKFCLRSDVINGLKGITKYGILKYESVARR